MLLTEFVVTSYCAEISDHFGAVTCVVSRVVAMLTLLLNGKPGIELRRNEQVCEQIFSMLYWLSIQYHFSCSV